MHNIIINVAFQNFNIFFLVFIPEVENCTSVMVLFILFKIYFSFNSAFENFKRPSKIKAEWNVNSAFIGIRKLAPLFPTEKIN